MSIKVVNFFSNSVGRKDTEVELVSDNLLREILGVELPSEVGNSQVAPVLQEKIKNVIFAMNSNKAPGPDGYPTKKLGIMGNY
ncbi:hypothetical protein HRI_004076300 [Hibiscus trionum]|uniref:Uncharacterized protein n=1 Tax=Hibiscus trionum TaxID=183268 RepID=A0A9W7IWT4_HIBTR|nr:hypothetical protein HRI_004076300 [Hibiscus trionum]